MFKLSNVILVFTYIFILFGVPTAYAKENIGDVFKDYKYELSACAIFQNEDRFLKEWVEFHLVSGVQHFWLFNNLSTDNFRKILQPYIDKGIVELIEWPYESKDVKEWNTIQCNSYRRALELARGKSKWLAILDSDEFLFAVDGTNLRKILKKYSKYGGVCVNWQMYGTSGVARVPKDKFLIETLLYRAETNYQENIHIKSIVQPMRVLDIKNPHYCVYKEGYIAVNMNKKPVPGPFNEPILVDKARINHYWARDEEFLHFNKILRNVKWGGNIDDILRRVDIMNQIYDPVMLQFAKKMHKKLD